MIWVDTTGKTRQTIANVSVGTVAALQAALSTLSNGGVTQFWEGIQNNVAVTPTAARFPNVQDSADLVYGAADGSLVRITLPAPKHAIFLADLETVDPTTIVVVSAAVIGIMPTGTGALVTHYVGGVRRRKTIDY